jgi:ABC-2 type transport system ATP-binding protein
MAGSGGTLLALTPVGLLVVGLVIFCLVDLIRAPAVRYLPKPLWAFIILVGSTPLGAIVYLVAGRERQPAVSSVPENTERPAAGNAAGPAPAPMLAPAHRSDDGAVVQTAGLTRDYGGAGLFDVDLSVPRGSVYGLVGPNGAGKTTMLSILTGMRRSDRGDVRLSVPRSSVAVCPDVPEFDTWLTAYEVVDRARSLIGADRETHSPTTSPTMRPTTGTARAAVMDALRAAGLADVADRQVGGFSRGMTQRLGFACALVGDPELLILDEPTSALDPAGRAELLSLVAAMRGRRTVIFSSHILDDVQRVADQVGILRDGRLLYQGATQPLIDTHLRPRWLIRIAGDTTLLRAELDGQPWVTHVEPVGPNSLRVDGVSMEAGERGIPVAVAACRGRLVSCEPVAADLEAAFLALTNST